MSLDLARVGELAADLMDTLERDVANGRLAEDSEIGVVAIVVEVQNGDKTQIRYLCSDRRLWIQCALLREALDVAEDPEALDLDVDEDATED